MKDRRSKTSRANLGDHVPQALSARGTVIVSVRLPAEVAAQLDAECQRANLPRSVIIRWCLERALPESRTVPPYEPW